MGKKYIDYDELRNILKQRQIVRDTPERQDEIGEIIAVIDSMSTDSGTHARWLTTEAYPHWLYCSNCHMRFVPNHEWLAAYSIPANFCPHCGKPMWNGNSQNIWCGDMVTPKTDVIESIKNVGESAKSVSGALKNVVDAFENAEHCVSCGDVIPEGRQVCPKYEKGAENGTSD